MVLLNTERLLSCLERAKKEQKKTNEYKFILSWLVKKGIKCHSLSDS